MKLAEALVDRAAMQRELEQLLHRAKAASRYQEGTEPAENVDELLAAYARVSKALADLIVRINTTNLGTMVRPDLTMTAAIAERESLVRQARALQEVMDHASDIGDRYSRNEIRVLPALNIAEQHERTSALSRAARELDTAMQATNWSTELH